MSISLASALFSFFIFHSSQGFSVAALMRACAVDRELRTTRYIVVTCIDAASTRIKSTYLQIRVYNDDVNR